MIDRTSQPDLKKIDEIKFINLKKYKITENVNLYHMNNVSNKTTRFDLYFDAGKCRGNNTISSFVNGLLLSGTKDKTSVQINNEINNRGGFYESGITHENSIISVYSLNENILEIFNSVKYAIKNTAFIKKEVKEYLSDQKQLFKINLEKVSYLARREFQKELFNTNKDYAYNTKLSDFDSVKIDDLKKFHSKFYLKGLLKIVVIGDLDQKIINHIINESREFAIKSKCKFISEIKNIPSTHYIERKKSLQSAIRLGRILFNKNHPDYNDFLILNTIIGGYFGSRLMSNIREDKGYTYGINSFISEFKNVGFFIITSEVGSKFINATLKEIKIEFERLKNELISSKELNLIKNYMLGQILKNADGPYAMTDLFIDVENYNLNLDFYNKLIKSINKINPVRIQKLAQKYLNWNDMTIVSVG